MMRQVPDNHYIWKYSDPTRTYYVQGLGEDRHGDNPLELLLRPQTNKILHQFIDWYEKQLMITYELRKTIPPIFAQVILDSLEPPTDTQTSSIAIESSSSGPTTWGNSRARNHAEELKQWQETPTQDNIKDHAQYNTSAQNEDSPYDRTPASTFLRFYSNEPAYLNPNASPLNATTDTGSSTHTSKRPTRDAREEREDEQEFHRIPIAGEDSEDYQREYWETDSNDSHDHDPNSQEESKDNEETSVFTTNMYRIVSLPTTPLPIVEPLPYSYEHELTGVPMTASMTPFNTTAFTSDDIAYLIGDVDGIVQSHQLTPIPTHVNSFHELNEVNDKVHFTQNMHGMMRGEHKRKLTKSAKQMDRSTNDFNLLLFSSLSVHEVTREVPLQDRTSRAKKQSASKYRRLNTSPITVPGTPDSDTTLTQRHPKRFPSPNYAHRDTNYRQPSLTDRLSLDDIMKDWPTESFCPIRPKKRIMTESQFDFSNERFPHELYRVGGANMVREYTQRREQRTKPNSDDDKSTDSERSLKIFEKAYACFKPEPGESNAESAERHRLIEERVFELKQERKRKVNPKNSTRIQHQFETSPLLRNTISKIEYRYVT